MATARSEAPQSVERIFSILALLASEGDGATLAEIARKLQAPKSSVVNLLAGMVEGGILIHEPTARYRIGPGMLSLAMRIVAGSDLSLLVRPVLERLAADTGETALAGALAISGDRSAYIEKVESSNPVRYTVPLGEQRELYSSAIGKILLAHMPRDRLAAYLKQKSLVAFTPNTITSVRALRAELSSIREAGFSNTCDEQVMGASALAAPVFDRNGVLVAGLVIAGPSERMQKHRTRNVELLTKEAKQLSTFIGAPP